MAEDDTDARAFIEALRPVRATYEGPYTFLDRYRDFATVFGTEQGKRVLAQILYMTDSPANEKDAQSHATLAYRSGLRMAGMKIAEWTTVPPRGEPQKD